MLPLFFVDVAHVVAVVVAAALVVVVVVVVPYVVLVDVVGDAADPRIVLVDAPPPRTIARRSLVKLELRVETCPSSKPVAPASRVGS